MKKLISDPYPIQVCKRGLVNSLKVEPSQAEIQRCTDKTVNTVVVMERYERKRQKFTKDITCIVHDISLAAIEHIA
jgi:hypothetical protein